MPKQMLKLARTGGATRDLALDIVSHGRRGPGGTLRLGQAQIEQVQRTVGRTPEVMVKVSGGGRDSGTVRAHLKYVGRHGKLSIETDEGVEIQGKGAADELVDEWALDECRGAHRPKPAEGEKDTRAKLVHNIVLSMPAGTPPEKVLAAAKVFGRENFALQHRYAMVLHTDQAHPHVHLVVKCEHEYEPRKRLYIRKDTLRRWREQFAELIREQGVAANATPRQIRGQTRQPLRDPIHHRLRAMRAFNQLDGKERERRTAPSPSRFMRRKVLETLERVKGAVPRWTMASRRCRVRAMASQPTGVRPPRRCVGRAERIWLRRSTGSWLTWRRFRRMPSSWQEGGSATSTHPLQHGPVRPTRPIAEG